MRRFAVALTLLLLPAAARAETITLGGSDGTGFAWPFATGLRVQQVFDSSLFNGTWTFTGITFYNRVVHSAEGFVEPATYQFFLSTTPISSTTLTPVYDANLGLDTTRVREWTVSDFSVAFTDALTLAFTTPFSFDPQSGNLLLDVRKNMTGDYGDGGIYVDGDVGGSPGISIVGNIPSHPRFGGGGDFLTRNSGFLVTFDGTFTPFEPAPTPTPEPASMLLVAGGLAALARRRHVRRSAAGVTSATR